MPRIPVAALALTIVCASGTALAVSPLAADTPASAPSGASYVGPKAWTVRADVQKVVIDAPEGDTHIAIVGVPQSDAADAKAAASAAWHAYRPAGEHPFKLATPRPARDGWDERQIVDYETSPNEHVVLRAIALRRARQWTVAILDGSEATVEKRGAAIALVFQSLRPGDYARESFAGRAAHRLDPARVEAMRSFVQSAMGTLGIPGASFALIDHGTVVYEGGLGVRELGKPEPVDAHSVFMIASNTKGMATLLLAQLVDDGKLSWNEPVTQVYPSFRLGSEATTRQVLVKHLVCACTGLPRKDFDWIFNTAKTTPASTTFDQLAATEPTSGFGEVFQYNNLMASAAGYIGGHLVHPDREIGAAFDTAMQERIFDPLGMADTTLSMSRALAVNHASPHGDDIDGQPRLAAMAFNDMIMPYRPAGGAWSSAHDMIRYVQDEISEGVLPDGRRLVSAKSLLARREHGVPTGEDGWYGMGLEETRTWGVPVVHHGGSMAGYKSDIMLIPEAQVGAVILTNSDKGQMLLRPFMRRLLEVLYDGKPEAAEDVVGAAARYRANLVKDRERLDRPPLPEASAALAPSYVSPELGRIDVKTSAQGVRFVFRSWSSEVASRRNDDGTISFLTVDPTNDGFEFVVATRDGRRVLTTRDGQHEYTFVEVGA